MPIGFSYFLIDEPDKRRWSFKWKKLNLRGTFGTIQRPADAWGVWCDWNEQGWAVCALNSKPYFLKKKNPRRSEPKEGEKSTNVQMFEGCFCEGSR